MPPRLASATATAIAACLIACALPAARPASRDPAFDDARSCLGVATWIDRVEGPLAVAIDPQGAARVLALVDLAPGAHEGSALVNGAPSPRCEARVRAYLKALRGVNANAGDTSNALPLE
ncbi:MAG: hypothetical protein CVU56_02015 [Deltaproteobacteria bacterium HGW-Deltaproteobacteria-14]|jgi:hypothetical protein|nr:MAG: hypothetical protein CVU56_02015 [Deltaproteobacteria bacterium HGW-Deltaproteobacteria-14]